MIKIVIVDDNEFYRIGLKVGLSSFPHYIVIGEFENGAQFLEAVSSLNPDVVLMDIKMPVMNGIEASRLALDNSPKLKIIAITMFGEEQYLKEMLKIRIHGFLLKDIDKEMLDIAIRQVYDGNNFYSSELLKKFTTDYFPSQFYSKNDENLTNRELEILNLVAQGYSNAEISDKLCISLRTVEGHKTKIVTKTESKNIIEVIIHALKKGIITIE